MLNLVSKRELILTNFEFSNFTSLLNKQLPLTSICKRETWNFLDKLEVQNNLVCQVKQLQLV